jgi:hypothetical protein
MAFSAAQPHIVAYYRVQVCFLRRRAFFRLPATPGPFRALPYAQLVRLC